MEYFTNPANHIVSAYKERNISPDVDQIYSTFPEYNDRRGVDRDDRNARWVSKHLKYDTLLSREELALYISLRTRKNCSQLNNLYRYSKLESSGDLRNIDCNTDVDATRPFLDQDIQSAIESLNASTTAVGKQAQALMTQFENCGRHFHREDDRWTTSDSDLGSLDSKHAIGWQNINAAVIILV